MVRLISILALYFSTAYAAAFLCDSTLDINFKTKPKYKISKLNHPTRLLVDIEDIDDLKIVKRTTGKCITKVRMGSIAKNNMRLVLELNHAMEHTASTKMIPGGYQLRVNLKDKKVANKKVYHDYVKAKVSSKSKDMIIVVDPGHGGHDPGAIAKGNIREKNITLAIGKKLANKINSLQNVRAYLTRSTDKYLTLRNRLRFARDHHADLFISIHADSNPNKAAHGASVYALSERGATSEAARVLADKENLGSVINKRYSDDLALNAVLLDLLQVSTVHSSLYFGKTMLSKLCKVSPCHRNNVEQAGFMVLKSPKIPSVLIETGFISNAKEAKRLVSNAYQESLTDAMLAAIKLYIHYSPTVKALRTVKVGKGDTLYGLAKKYHTSAKKIAADNGIKNNKLAIGDKLKIM